MLFLITKAAWISRHAAVTRLHPNIPDRLLIIENGFITRIEIKLRSAYSEVQTTETETCKSDPLTNIVLVNGNVQIVSSLFYAIFY